MDKDFRNYITSQASGKAHSFFFFILDFCILFYKRRQLIKYVSVEKIAQSIYGF